GCLSGNNLRRANESHAVLADLVFARLQLLFAFCSLGLGFASRIVVAIRRRLLGARCSDDTRHTDEGNTTNVHTLLIYSVASSCARQAVTPFRAIKPAKRLTALSEVVDLHHPNPRAILAPNDRGVISRRYRA